VRAERAVVALLNAAAPVTGIVGTRIYGNVPPENSAAPLIVYRKLAASRVPTLSLSQLAEVDARIELLLVATSYAQLKDLAEQVRVALAYQRGAIGGTDVLHITVDDEGPDEYDADLREHAQTWVYLVKHSE
jgi:hypothetical protein